MSGKADFIYIHLTIIYEPTHNIIPNSTQTVCTHNLEYVPKVLQHPSIKVGRFTTSLYKKIYAEFSYAGLESNNA